MTLKDATTRRERAIDVDDGAGRRSAMTQVVPAPIPDRSHAIYDRFVGATVSIVRILHHAMHAAARLDTLR